MISVTESAVKHLQALVQEDGGSARGLRLYVEKGGCAGLQYGMKLDDVAEGDEVATEGGVSVLIDPESAAYLRGITLDYCDDLTGTGFRIQNPQAVRSCGCGTSFETAPAESGAAAPEPSRAA